MSNETEIATLLREIRDDNMRLRDQNEELMRENRRLSEQLTTLINRVYGRSSEKIDPNQLRLFEDGLPLDEALEAPAPLPASPKKKSKGHGRTAFPEHLARIEIDCDVPKDDRSCDSCGDSLVPIGADVTERGHVVPARIVVHRYLKKKYACPKGHGIKTGVAPAALIERCKYEPSVYAQIAVAKYADHTPLTRQETIWKRQGMPIAKSTMWEMLQRVDEIAATPIVEQMRKEVLEEAVVHADETPITVLTDGQKGQKTGYIWVYTAAGKAVFDFTSGRGRDGPIRFLSGFSKVIVADGYAGYDEVERRNGITRAGCWSHARRRFKEALDGKEPRSAPVLRLIARLYRIERAVENRCRDQQLGAEEGLSLRAEVRRRLSRAVVDRLERLFLNLRAKHSVLPKSLLGKAVAYAVGQWPRLNRFLEDARIPLDNNAAERALRPVALGRKNWLFAGSDRGAKCAANLYSLMASCKALNINPTEYLEEALVAVATTPASEIASLTPWAWAARRNASQPV